MLQGTETSLEKRYDLIVKNLRTLQNEHSDIVSEIGKVLQICPKENGILKAVLGNRFLGEDTETIGKFFNKVVEYRKGDLRADYVRNQLGTSMPSAYALEEQGISKMTIIRAFQNAQAAFNTSTNRKGSNNGYMY